MKDHDTLVPSKDGKTWDLRKADETAPRPHADGCVGCRRESVCVVCGTPATLDVNRCISGACVKCCWMTHKPHLVAHKLVINHTLPKLLDAAEVRTVKR